MIKPNKNEIRGMASATLFGLILLIVPPVNAGSICYGTTSNGKLERAVQLPSDGTNFTSYSWLGEQLGRTWVHTEVKAILTKAWAKLETEQPKKKFKYAETGFKDGGKFKPHKTHQNGLSVDFMVPVIDQSGESVFLPTNALNKWGYDIEFSNSGQFEDYKIDFEALAAHLVALHKASLKQNANIWRVIFAPELQPLLLRTKYGNYIKKNIQLSKKRSWVRHDEHYHVDFKIPCQPLK